MATQSTSNLAPVTQESFMAERQQTWSSVRHMAIGSAIFMAVLLSLMAFFLV